MIFDEQDVDFKKLKSSQEFEELCFDLLLKLGFHSLVWRQGGADSGRDIEAKYTQSNPLVGVYNEKWFVECKWYSKGVPVREIDSKIAWADAKKPKHFAIITSSYLSNPARTWLEDRTVSSPYQVHIVEGKQLKQLLLYFPALVSRYFGDKYEKLLHEAQANWRAHNLLPDPKKFLVLFGNIDPRKLSKSDLAFLWCSAYAQIQEIDDWYFLKQERYPSFSFDYLFEYLKGVSDSNQPILSQYTFEKDFVRAGSDHDRSKCPRYISAQLRVSDGEAQQCAMYFFGVDSDDEASEGLEVLILADEAFSAKVRFVSANVEKEFYETEVLFDLPWTRNTSNNKPVLDKTT